MMHSPKFSISLLSGVLVMTALGGVAFYAHSTSHAQQSTQNQDVNDLLDQLTQQQTTNGTDTGTDGGGSTSPDEPGVSGTTWQPIVENQFATHTSGDLQARRPGNYVQNLLAEAQGSSDLLVGDADPQPGFIFETFELIFLSITDSLNDLIAALNLGFGLGGIDDPTNGTDGLTFPGAVTSGQGTTTPLN